MEKLIHNRFWAYFRILLEREKIAFNYVRFSCFVATKQDYLCQIIYRFGHTFLIQSTHNIIFPKYCC